MEEASHRQSVEKHILDKGLSVFQSGVGCCHQIGSTLLATGCHSSNTRRQLGRLLLVSLKGVHTQRLTSQVFGRSGLPTVDSVLAFA